MRIFIILLLAEIKKTIGKKYVPIIYLCFTIAFGIYMYSYYYADISDLEGEIRLYENINGMLTEEKYDFLNNELKELDLDIDYENIEFSTDTKGAQDKGKYMPTKIADQVVFESAIKQCEFIIENENNRKIIIDRAKDNILENQSINDAKSSYNIAYNQKIIDTYNDQPQVYIMDPYIKTTWYSCISYNVHSCIIIIILILIISPIFSNEKETGMQPLINTLKKGKGTMFSVKFFTAILVSIFTAIYFEVLQIVYYKIIIPELYGFDYSIQTIIPRCPFDISIGEVLLIKTLCVCLASIVIGVTILFFSVTSKKNVVCVGKSIAYIIVIYGTVFYQKIWLTDIIREESLMHIAEKMDCLKNILFSYLFYPLDYLDKFECLNICNIPVFSLNNIIIIAILGIVSVMAASYYVYAKKI